MTSHSPRQDNFRMEMYEVDKSRIDCVGSVDNDDQKIYWRFYFPGVRIGERVEPKSINDS